MIEDVALFDTDAWLRFSLIQTSLLSKVKTVEFQEAETVSTAIIYLTHRLAAFVWIGLMFV